MKKIILLLAFAGLAGCAHHRDVRAGADGVHRVVVQTDDKEEGSRDAIRQANHFCEKRNLAAAFMEENQKYTGSGKEEDYNRNKTIAKAAQMAGGTVWALGGQSESNVGGIVGLGGAVANNALGKGYTVDMKFKCQ